MALTFSYNNLFMEDYYPQPSGTRWVYVDRSASSSDANSVDTGPGANITEAMAADSTDLANLRARRGGFFAKAAAYLRVGDRIRVVLGSGTTATNYEYSYVNLVDDEHVFTHTDSSTSGVTTTIANDQTIDRVAVDITDLVAGPTTDSR